MLSANEIKDISIKGNQRISKETVIVLGSIDLNKEYIVCKYHRIWKTLKMFNEKENIE